MYGHRIAPHLAVHVVLKPNERYVFLVDDTPRDQLNLAKVLATFVSRDDLSFSQDDKDRVLDKAPRYE